MHNQERYHGLDFVRASAMLLGLVIHTSICFTTDSLRAPFASGNYQGDIINDFACNFIHLFRMQLFFILAGFFANLVIKRKGLNYIFKERFRRIILPFLVGIFIFMPINFLVCNINGFYSSTLDGLSIYESFKSLLLWGAFSDREIYPMIGFIHFWFVYYLIIFYVIHFAFLALSKKIKFTKTNRLFSKIFDFIFRYKSAFLLLPLITFPIHYSLNNPLFPPTQFNVNINELFYYFVCYSFGALLFNNIILLKRISDNSLLYFIICIPIFLFIHDPTSNLIRSPSVIADITNWKLFELNLYMEGIFHSGIEKVFIVYARCLACWGLCLSFIGLAHRFLNKENKYIRYFSDSAYWAYWIHVIITFGLSRFVQPINWLNSLTRSYLVLVLSTIIIYWSYNKFIRYTFLGDYFMGKRKSRDSPDEKYFQISYHLPKLSYYIFATTVVVFLLGSLLNMSTDYRKNSVIIESFISRDKATLEKVVSLDNILDDHDLTPLHVATENPQNLKRYNSMEILITKTDNYNPVDINNRTPLFYAVRSGNTQDINTLIKAGAKLDIADKYGHTPAHVAAIKTGAYGKKASNDYFAILKLLKDKGADFTLKDYRGRSVNDCLIYFGDRTLD